MQIHSKATGTRGLVSTYNEALRFRDMITKEAQERVRILAFRDKHGDGATQEAFRVSRATLFRWQRLQRDGGGKLEAGASRQQDVLPANHRARAV